MVKKEIGSRKGIIVAKNDVLMSPTKNIMKLETIMEKVKDLSIIAKTSTN